MRVTIFILAVLAVHISCIYCRPASQPGGNLPPPPPPPFGAKQEPPKGKDKPELPEILNEIFRPPYPQGENGQSPPPRPNQDKLLSINPQPQGGNDQTASPRP
ncbi:hypothetical protein ACJMK2_026574 [Sinanodonta woodiana]|uniref:Uncharacterized protein n=1 Tax=Sinanodonta woodiana TaxID=1069815 RepID=A0ABD3XLL9_SINWO